MKRFIVSIVGPGVSRIAYDFSGKKSAVSAFRLACRAGECDGAAAHSFCETWARNAEVGDSYSRTPPDPFRTIIITRIR